MHKDLVWQVEKKDKKIINEYEINNYKDIPIDEINRISVYHKTEPKSVSYLVDLDRIMLFESNEKPMTKNIYFKSNNDYQLDFIMYKGSKGYKLGLDNLIKQKPIFFKRAFTDFDPSKGGSVTQIEGYFVGFENEYKVDNKPLKFKFVIGVAKNFNTLTGNYFYSINKGIIRLNGELGHKLEILTNGRTAVHVVIDKPNVFSKEFQFIQ